MALILQMDDDAIVKPEPITRTLSRGLIFSKALRFQGSAMIRSSAPNAASTAKGSLGGKWPSQSATASAPSLLPSDKRSVHAPAPLRRSTQFAAIWVMATCPSARAKAVASTSST
jgi:hypothetical protein